MLANLTHQKLSKIEEVAPHESEFSFQNFDFTFDPGITGTNHKEVAKFQVEPPHWFEIGMLWYKKLR